MMLETAAETDELAAVVSEGAGARMLRRGVRPGRARPARRRSARRGSAQERRRSPSSPTSRRRPTSRPGRADRAAAAAADRRAEQPQRRGAQPRLPRRGARAQGAVGDPGVRARRRPRGAAAGVRAPRGRLLRPERWGDERGARVHRRDGRAPRARARRRVRPPAAGARPRPARPRGAGRAGRRRRGDRGVPVPAARPQGRRRGPASACSAWSTARMHVQHVRVDAVAASDLTGVLAVGAALVLLGLAAAIPYRHRGERPHRRWLAGRSCCPPGCWPRSWSSLPVSPRGRRRAQVARADRPAAERRLRARGLQGRRRAGAEGLVPPVAQRRRGAPRPRRQQRPHRLRGPRALLARAGYGVLLYDARGRGESEGSANGYGWGWEHDVDGALRLLAARAGRRRRAHRRARALDRRGHPARRRARARRPRGDRRRRRRGELVGGLAAAARRRARTAAGWVMFGRSMLSGDPPGPPSRTSRAATRPCC